MADIPFKCGKQGPDRKVVVAYLAYLCARLLEVSQEERAAYTIQRLWKRWQARQPGCPPTWHPSYPIQNPIPEQSHMTSSHRVASCMCMPPVE